MTLSILTTILQYSGTKKEGRWCVVTFFLGGVGEECGGNQGKEMRKEKKKAK